MRSVRMFGMASNVALVTVAHMAGTGASEANNK